jgi:hypothetical protein
MMLSIDRVIELEPLRPYILTPLTSCACRTTDSTSVFGTDDGGSIPSGRTIKNDPAAAGSFLSIKKAAHGAAASSGRREIMRRGLPDCVREDLRHGSD